MSEDNGESAAALPLVFKEPECSRCGADTGFDGSSRWCENCGMEWHADGRPIAPSGGDAQ